MMCHGITNQEYHQQCLLEVIIETTLKKTDRKEREYQCGTFKSKRNQTASLSYPLDYHESYNREISANTLTRNTFCTD